MHHHARVSVFGSSAVQPADDTYRAALALGRLLAGHGITVVTGGYGGVMEAASRGANHAGGRVIGVTAPTVFLERNGPNRWVHEEVRAASITERIHLLMDSADMAVIMPGAVGTAAELMVAWNVSHVETGPGRAPFTLVLVGDHWRPLVDLLVGQYGTSRRNLVEVGDVEQAVAVVVDGLHESAHLRGDPR